MQQIGHYLVLFPNPAYARTYQSHVVHLHRVARTHTPSSIESPLPLRPGVLIEGQDVHSLLQDYALCPPSQRIQLKLLQPSHAAGINSILQQRGYRQLVQGEAKTGRSVLFWVDGQHLNTSVIRNAVAADGRDRGLAWDVSFDKVEDLKAISDEEIHRETDDYEGSTEPKTSQRSSCRWIMSFTDESEARRFIRSWHRKHFPMARGDGPRLVHTEFLW